MAISKLMTGMIEADQKLVKQVPRLQQHLETVKNEIADMTKGSTDYDSVRYAKLVHLKNELTEKIDELRYTGLVGPEISGGGRYAGKRSENEGR